MMEKSLKVGEEIAKKALVKKIEKVVKIEPPKIPVSREEDALTKELMEIQKKLQSFLKRLFLIR